MPLFCKHTLDASLCISWHVWVGFSAANCLLLWLQPPSQLHNISSPGPDSSCPVRERRGLREAPKSGSQEPVFRRRQPAWHHLAGSLEAGKRPSRRYPCSAQPGSRSVCFHQAEMHLPLASRGLISSNAGGGCPWTPSRSCPLLAGSRIGGWTQGTRRCGFRLSLQPRGLFPRETLRWRGSYNKKHYGQSWHTEQPRSLPPKINMCENASPCP